MSSPDATWAQCPLCGEWMGAEPHPGPGGLPERRRIVAALKMRAHAARVHRLTPEEIAAVKRGQR